MGEKVQRSAEEQAAVDEATAKLTLYQFAMCPFCAKVRYAVEDMNLNLPIKNADRDDTAQQELIQGGGMFQTPCLRIENEHGAVEWMYESDDIISYLHQRFVHA